MGKEIPSRSEDYSLWYNELVKKADLAEHSDVRGCMVIKPYGYSIWEKMQAALDKMFKDTGHLNAYFPLFVPKSMFEAEEKNAEGFAKECAIVTHYRLKTDPENPGKLIVDPEAKLEEELVVRPTSEAIIWNTYKKWIQSYRDLPLLINQWANVVRWEMRTRLFLRTAEFLWQEGHTAHATYEEAQEETMRMLDVYAEFAIDDAAIPVIKGRKSNQERFAGAKDSYSIEAMMGDKKALQAGTSHNLGQNFAKAFEIDFTDENNAQQYCWTTSWGMSTRMVGAIVMAHGDDKGLRLPPKVAPIQVVIVPIYKSEDQAAPVMEAVKRIAAELRGIGMRVHVDSREGLSPGFKYNDWEMRGVPVRLEVGPKDIEKNSVALARRDVPGKEGKQFVSQDGLVGTVRALLDDIQVAMLRQATEFRDANIHEVVGDYGKFCDILKEAWALSWFCGGRECEMKIKADNQAVSRCFPLEQPHPGESGPCIACGETAHEMAYFAKAY